MGLSYYYNWGTIQQQYNQDRGLFIEQSTPPPPLPELAPELLSFHDDFSLDDTCIDPLFKPLPPPPVPPLHDNDPFLLSHPNLLSPLPEIFPSVLLDSSTYNLYYYPKRQKTSHHDDHHNNVLDHDYFGGLLLDATTTDLGNNRFYLPIMNPNEKPIWFPDLPLELLSPPHHHEFQMTTRTCDQDHPLPAVYSCESISCVDFQETTNTSTCVKKANASSKGTLSAQSIAAWLRRKKITDKTRELGKLIPGGHKMNTAEMFQAASKYIKFLQAQVGVLQHMPTIQENEGGFDDKEFQALVTSPLVQEKFYAAEKCLAPKKLVESILENDHQFQSKPQLFEDINELIKKTD